MLLYSFSSSFLFSSSKSSSYSSKIFFFYYILCRIFVRLHTRTNTHTTLLTWLVFRPIIHFVVVVVDEFLIFGNFSLRLIVFNDFILGLSKNVIIIIINIVILVIILIPSS